MKDLIKRLENAGEGSPSLDIQIALATGWVTRPSPIGQGYLYYPSANSRNKAVPDYTTSIDAKISGENIISVKKIEFNMWRAVHEIEPPHHQLGGGRTTVGIAKTEALARRIAALKAKQP